MIPTRTFDFSGLELRVLMHMAEPKFFLGDVCKGLGLAAHNGSYAHHAVRLDPDEVSKCDRTTLGMRPGRVATLVSESGLYKLIMRSDKAEAHKFQDWVTKIVLPAIRKDGGYVMGEEKVVTGEMSEDELVLKAMEVMQTKITRLRDENLKLKADNEQLTPLAAVGARAVSHEHTLARFIRTLSGVNTTKIKGDLKAHNYLYKLGGTYRVYARFQHLFIERLDGTYGNVDIFPTAAGRALIIEMYEAGRLTGGPAELKAYAAGQAGTEKHNM